VRIGVRAAARASGLLCLLWAGTARAQGTTVLAPEASDAKAREVIEQSIQALGGAAYLGVRDISSVSRIGQFGHSGAVTGYEVLYDFKILPDKDRLEISKKRNIINVWNGDDAWTLDRGGVSDGPVGAVERNQEALHKSVNHLFRFRLRDPEVVLRYAGLDMVDLKQVDWVEASDAQRYTLRIAIDHATHLPVRAVCTWRDPKTREQTEEIEYFSDYHSIQGVMTPLQDFRERNGLQTYQLFTLEVKYNTGLSPDLFTRQSLEEKWAHTGKGKKGTEEKP